MAACPIRHEIIVVDNASVDASVELITREFPQVKLIQLPENRGPGAARNAAWAAAGGDYVLFIDNDVVVAQDCPAHLLESMRKTPGIVVAMPRVCFADRPDTIQYDGAGCHPIGLMTLYNQNVPVIEAKDSARFMHSVVTACILVDRHALGTGEPFDESFFFNYEDHDFGLRCSLADRPIVSEPAALCYHGAGTEGLSYREKGEYTNRRAYYLIRNRWIILLKNYQLRTLLVLSPILVVFEIFQLGGMVMKGRTLQWLKSAGWIITRLPRILRKRSRIQQTRQVSDMELFDFVPLPFTDEMAGGRLAASLIAILDSMILGYLRLIRADQRRRDGSHG
jgi:GT2 family glycosyltransferase